MSAMKVLCSIWRLLDPGQKRRLVAMQFVSVLMAVCTVGGMAAVLPFFTVLAEPHAIQSHPALRAFYEHLHFVDENRFVAALGVLFVTGVLISNIVNLIGSLAIDRFAFEVGDTLHTDLFDEYLHRGYGFHSRTHSATLTSNVLYETGRVAGGILRHGLILVTSLVTVFCIVASILLLNPQVAIFAVAGLGASYVGVYAAARDKLRRNGEKESEDFAERTRIVGESFGAIKEIIVLQAQSVFVARLARCCRSISNTIVGNLAIAQSPRHILECVTVCVLVGVALYSHLRGESVGPLIAQLSFIGLAVYRLLPGLQQVFLAIVRIRSDSPAFERIATDLRLARARKPGAERAVISPSWLGKPHRDIHLKAVSFAHSQGGHPAIANLNLRLRAGAVVGFIGANGSGKTTLIDLLSGLLVPESGSVEIDGVALNPMNRSAWRAAIAYVPQNIFLCDSTLAENVALGIDSAKIDRQRLRAVLELAQLRTCVADLPKGVDEPVGERGARLSGGQRQRLGIARALYRDASLIIMDEATSALDAAAERDITDMIAEYRGRKTIVLVAHRMSALMHCDVIYELANGRIVRSGTFQQLQTQAAELGAGRSDVRLSDCESKESARGFVKPPIVGHAEGEKGFDEARRLAADGG
jgi:ABC-type multidrug transport system fused ATPase/permease subunit